MTLTGRTTQFFVFLGLLLPYAPAFGKDVHGVDMGGEVRPRLVRGDEKLDSRLVKRRDNKKSSKKRMVSKSNFSRRRKTVFVPASSGSGIRYAQAKNPNFPSAVEELDSAQSKTAVSPEEKQTLMQKTAWTVGASHNGGFYEDREQTTSYFGSFIFSLNSDQSFSVAQSFNQGYRVNPGVDDRGFTANDTVLGYNQTLFNDLLTAKWLGKLSATLPVSERSNRLDVNSITTATVSIARSFFDKKLSVSISPMGRYYFSEYTTTPTSPGSGGGNPLPHWMYGVGGSMTYGWSEALSLTGAASWYTQYLYKTKYENEDPLYGYTNPPKNSYSLSLSASYKISKAWNATLTYAHADRYEQPWGTEYLVFNDRITTWSLGTSYTF